MIQADIVGSNKFGLFLGASLAAHVAVLGTLPVESSSNRLPAPRSITLVLQPASNKPAATAAGAPAAESTATNLSVMSPAKGDTQTVQPAPAIPIVAVVKTPTREPAHKARMQAPLKEIKRAKTGGPNQVPSPSPPPLTEEHLALARASESTAMQSSPPSAGNPTPSSFATTTEYSQTAEARAAIDLSRLSALLHQKILQYQRYPTLARRQRREGVATVSFQLYPSGELQAVSLGNSSGNKALDSAALRAVQSVSPFLQAGDYLTRAQEFSVNVVFNLR